MIDWHNKLCYEKFRYFYVTLILLFVLNVFDALCTAYWISAGLAVEKNPIMAYLISFDIKMFVLVKLLICALGVWYLWGRAHVYLARFLVTLITLVYAIICAYHTENIIQYLMS